MIVSMFSVEPGQYGNFGVVNYGVERGRRATLQAELRKGWQTSRAGSFPSYFI